jgi:hypothetical protein
LRTTEKDPAHHQRRDPFGIGFGIGQRQRRPPGTAEHQPALDPELLTNQFHVRDQIPGGIGHERGMRRRAPAAALIEQHRPIALGIEETAMRRLAPRARPAMQKDRRNPIGTSAFLDIEPMPIVDDQLMDREGFGDG